jgi:hypothetical protein
VRHGSSIVGLVLIIVILLAPALPGRRRLSMTFPNASHGSSSKSPSIPAAKTQARGEVEPPAGAVEEDKPVEQPKLKALPRVADRAGTQDRGVRRQKAQEVTKNVAQVTGCSTRMENIEVAAGVSQQVAATATRARARGVMGGRSSEQLGTVGDCHLVGMSGSAIDNQGISIAPTMTSRSTASRGGGSGAAASEWSDWRTGNAVRTEQRVSIERRAPLRAGHSVQDNG